mmetsp:Transcript_28097/g.69492  ORF Transcript_28097/g.69492 Transcript_28097/m.69492 type:complete len:942 (-) Transcript_28097:204-3029(-)|eukprot:CAMPEP_0206241128 /NCGR_PEP_ID=MMETSP0047_2-20121206/16329_1 /ASSEMBLY_ACC=CAM_ASM_000192 /TAXON_ID=195065 /ORGANISM="Chroomonas mesostigmatica_cf, Strain CCMP1168" /LENGTH=941 /DNA_ID=CAMNT_0053666001 /DNA_START=65 /DNA_END=2890 /DNA_ORIENTATION=+
MANRAAHDWTVDSAMLWARRSGFTESQLPEFQGFLALVESMLINKRDILGSKALDKGAFGAIDAATLHGTPVAVKRVSSGGDGKALPQLMREALLELRILQVLRHPHVVSFMGCAADFPQGGTPYIGLVFEMCSKGSLAKILHESKVRLTFPDKVRLGREIAMGMTYLHSLKIVHRDLNTRNILLTDDMRVRIADFGCARKISGETYESSTISGSPAYMPPEQLQGQALTLKVDVWAFGTILWELASEKLPWSHIQGDWTQIKDRVCTHGEGLPLLPDRAVPDEPKGTREKYNGLIHKAYSKSPAHRPTFAECQQVLTEISTPVRSRPSPKLNAGIPQASVDRFPVSRRTPTASAPSPSLAPQREVAKPPPPPSLISDGKLGPDRRVISVTERPLGTNGTTTPSSSLSSLPAKPPMSPSSKDASKPSTPVKASSLSSALSSGAVRASPLPSSEYKAASSKAAAPPLKAPASGIIPRASAIIVDLPTRKSSLNGATPLPSGPASATVTPSSTTASSTSGSILPLRVIKEVVREKLDGGVEIERVVVPERVVIPAPEATVIKLPSPDRQRIPDLQAGALEQAQLGASQAQLGSSQVFHEVTVEREAQQRELVYGRLLNFYSKHNPTKMGDVDRLLQQYGTSEVHLNSMLRAKYNCDLDSDIPYAQNRAPNGQRGCESCPHSSQAGLSGWHEIRLPDGGHYVGEMLNGQQHGAGRLRLGDGKVFEGRWEKGAMVQAGQLDLPESMLVESVVPASRFTVHDRGTTERDRSLFRDKLVEFYAAHNPSNLQHVDVIVNKYIGNQGELNSVMRAKYGVDLNGVQNVLGLERLGPFDAQRSHITRHNSFPEEITNLNSPTFVDRGLTESRLNGLSGSGSRPLIRSYQPSHSIGDEIFVERSPAVNVRERVILNSENFSLESPSRRTYTRQVPYTDQFVSGSPRENLFLV